MWFILYIIGCIIMACCMAVGVYRYIMAPIDEEKRIEQKLKTERANHEAEKLVEMMNNKWKDLKIENLNTDIEVLKYHAKNMFVVTDATCRACEGAYGVDLMGVVNRYKETDTYKIYHLTKFSSVVENKEV